jgi:hypothetical protein
MLISMKSLERKGGYTAAWNSYGAHLDILDILLVYFFTAYQVIKHFDVKYLCCSFDMKKILI